MNSGQRPDPDRIYPRYPTKIYSDDRNFWTLGELLLKLRAEMRPFAGNHLTLQGTNQHFPHLSEPDVHEFSLFPLRDERVK